VRPAVQDQERRSRRREAVRPSPYGAGVSSTRSARVLIGAWGGLTWLEGSLVLRVARRSLRAKGRVRSSGAGRVEDPRRGRRRLRRGQTREKRLTVTGKPGVGGTVSRGEQGFEVGEAGGTVGGSALRSPGRPGNAPWPRRAERKPIVCGGTRRPREGAGVGETGGERRRGVRQGTPVDNCKGASGPERGARSS